MKRVALIALLLAAPSTMLLLACNPPRPQPGPSPLPPHERRVAAHILGEQGSELEGATVTLDGHPPFIGTTNANGYIAWQVPETLGASQITVTAAGHQRYTAHVDLPQPPTCSSPCDVQLPDILLRSAHKAPITDAAILDRWQTDFCCAPEPACPNGMIFTAEYMAQSDACRAATRAYLQRHHYWQVPINIGDGFGYHGKYPVFDNYRDVATVNERLHELWDADLIPVPVVIPDFYGVTTGTTAADAVATWDGRLGELADNGEFRQLATAIQIGWEINGWLNPPAIQATIEWLRAHFPEARLWVHFTDGHACGDDPCGDWYGRNVGRIAGVLYQDASYDAGAMAARDFDFLWRFGQPHGDHHNGYPAYPGMKFVDFENHAFRMFWTGWPTEAEGIRLHDDAYAKNAPGFTLHLFGNGGTRDLVPFGPRDAAAVAAVH